MSLYLSPFHYQIFPTSFHWFLYILYFAGNTWDKIWNESVKEILYAFCPITFHHFPIFSLLYFIFHFTFISYLLLLWKSMGKDAERMVAWKYKIFCIVIPLQLAYNFHAYHRYHKYKYKMHGKDMRVGKGIDISMYLPYPFYLSLFLSCFYISFCIRGERIWRG